MASTGISQEQIFELLQSPRRRYTLYYLLHEGNAVDLSDLATHVAAWEHDTTPDRLTTKQRKRVYISLYQTHIPKLEEVGLLDYDRETGTIHPLHRARHLERYLGDVSRPTIAWNQYYLTFSVLSLLLLGGMLAGIFPRTIFSNSIDVTILIIYSLLAIGQYLCYRRRIPRGSPPNLRHTEK
ncbi:hypothetical protein DMJ13_17805 [halophilic archaeon]|nr:hypothetical protein DMJ13_17805 [halophilic archaeon]